MKPDLKAKIIEFNRRRAADKAKASDLDIVVGELLKLPYGQLKKILTPEVLAVLEKYGYGGEE